MGNLSKNFSRREFECPCCGEAPISTLLISELQRLRDNIGRPIIVTSGYRCQKYNEDVGGVVGSQHVFGTAADIIVRGLTPAEVAREAVKIPNFRHGGIGVYQTFVHLDVRDDGPARWGQRWR